MALGFSKLIGDDSAVPGPTRRLADGDALSNTTFAGRTLQVEGRAGLADSPTDPRSRVMQGRRT